MLVSQTLYLARVDKLGDRFEGMFPKVDVKGLLQDEMTRQYNAEKAKNGRRFYYVNCWHANESESDAMWKVYSNHGIAIRTTVRQLQKSFGTKGSEHVWLLPVSHDFEKGWKGFPLSHATLQACLTKRKPFVHEQEVRVIWWDEDTERAGRPPYDGIRVRCDTKRLIDSVYLAPTNGRWKETIQRTLESFGITAQVVPSDLDPR